MSGGARSTHDGLSGHIVGVHIKEQVGIFAEEIVTTDTLGRRTGPRMRHTIEEKLRIVEETRARGASVAMVARRHHVNPNQVFAWRQLHRRAGHGKIVWPALRRVRAIPKSAWVRPGSRPEFLERYTSLELIDHDPPASRLILVDDFVTRGRTLLAAATVLHQAVPSAHLRAFALVRTEGLVPDIAAITAPTIGAIRYLGGDAFRSP